MKFRENEIVEDISNYIKSTYKEHYVGKNTQYMDLVMSDETIAEARGFLKHNTGKYINRYGKKDGLNKKDLYKAIHYIVLLLYLDHYNGDINESNS